MQKIIVTLACIALALPFTTSAIAVRDPNTDDVGDSCPTLTMTLKRGMRDATTQGQVSELQAFLEDHFNLSDEQLSSGYFGRMTQKYLIQFQQQYGLPAYGIAGTLTRAKISEVCKGGVQPVGCRIGGCSSQLCVDANSPDMASTCEYKEEYGCYQKTSRCERQANGQCGWTQTQELLQCLKGNTGIGEAPKLISAQPAAGVAPLIVNFQAQYPGCKGTNLQSYSFDFGDGVITNMSDLFPYASDSSCMPRTGTWQHTYTRAGAYFTRITPPGTGVQYTATITATDRKGIFPHTLEVRLSSAVAQRYMQAFLNSLTDPTEASKYRIDWGDGSPIEGLTCNMLASTQGAQAVAAAMMAPCQGHFASHTYKKYGTYYVRIVSATNGLELTGKSVSVYGAD